MTDEMRARNADILSKDTNEQLIARFVWYGQHFNPVDFDMCDTYEMIKAEILKRMRG